MKKPVFALVIVILVILVGCNLPSNQATEPTSPDAAFTQAAQTVAAELTRVALQASPTITITPTSNLPVDTPTSTITATPVYTATKTPLPCLMVGYTDATIDQTVPDNTIMAPSQAFVKTWRVRNIGTCTWNSSYQMVFDHGDGMGVPSNYAQTLTSGTVAPGQEVDVSVNLTAPTATGTFTGWWRFRDPNGVYFGINDGSSPWRVVIKVVNSTSVTLAPIPNPASGTIRADAGPFPDYTVGESNADITKTVETYLAYNISGIPSNATITQVKFDFSAYTTEGSPFGLGVLQAYIADYGAALDSADFVSGVQPGNIADWGSTTALNTIEASPEMKTALQSKVGSSRLILRIQFGGSNLNGTKDRITFTNPKLIVSYTTP